MANDGFDHIKTGDSSGDRRIVFRAPSDLKSNPRNARKHSRAQVAAIAKSIEAFGFNAPVLVDSGDTIIAGHGRVEAAKLLDLQQIPVLCLHHLTEAEAKAYALADNKLTDRSNWDDAALAVQLKELSELALTFDIDATGFEGPEFDFRIQSLEETESIDRADDFRLATGTPASTPGDLWHLGGHRILCGDALDNDALNGLMIGEKAAATFTDPPYNIPIDGNAAGHGKTGYREFAMAVGEMSTAEFTTFLTTALSNIKMNSASGGIIFACMDWRHMGEMLAAGRAAELDLLNLCVWVKPNGRLGSFYKSQHELVFVFKNGNDPHRNNIQLGKFGRNRTNVWNFSPPRSFARNYAPEDVESHPTVKPVLMVSDAILDCTKRNDIVLDPFLGSGTTLLAAERTGRRCYGIELDPIYVDTAIERWQRMTGQKALSPFGETFEFIKAKRRAGS